MGINGFADFNTVGPKRRALCVVAALYSLLHHHFIPAQILHQVRGNFKKGYLNLNISLQFA